MGLPGTSNGSFLASEGGDPDFLGFSIFGEINYTNTTMTTLAWLGGSYRRKVIHRLMEFWSSAAVSFNLWSAQWILMARD